MTRFIRIGLACALCAAALSLLGPASADPPNTLSLPSLVPRERPSPHYPSVLYADIAPTLTALAQTGRLRVEQIGRSAGGLPLLLATVSSPHNLARLPQIRALRQAMVAGDYPSPGTAAPLDDLPALVLLSAGWQGNVYAGVDAALETARWLCQDDGEATRRVLENVVLMVNVVPNPDGRVAGSPGNATDLEPARDLVAQSQPETRAVIELLAAWSPMVVIDVDRFASPMAITVSPPPGAVAARDLYDAWTMDIAHAMSAAVHAASGYAPETAIPSPEAAIGDWPPLDLATYATYHGAYGFGLTVASRDTTGVTALEAAIHGALAFVSEHRAALVRDQARLLCEGLLRAAPREAPEHTLTASGASPGWPSPGAPEAYLIPAEAPQQQDPHEAAALVNLLHANGVVVERLGDEIAVQGVRYPPGAYLVRLSQPKGGLAATLLWSPLAGTGVADPRASSGWSLPLAWGVTSAPLAHVPDVVIEPVGQAEPPPGSVEPGPAAGYAFPLTGNAAVAATNALLAQGVPLYWASAPFSACQRHHIAGTVVLSAGEDAAAEAVLLLTEQYGLHLQRLCTLPPALVRLRPLRVAAHADPGVSYVLRELGFGVETITAEALDAGADLPSYDVLVIAGQAPLWERLSPAGRRRLLAYLEGGGSLIAIGAAGADLVVAAGLADIDPTITSYHFVGLAAVTCDRDDPLTAAYPEHTIAFVRAPVWFTHLPEDARPLAHLSAAGPLLSGYWPVWDDINPAGQPVIVHLPREGGALTLFGLDPTYAAYTHHTYRLLAQAIYRATSPRAP